MTLALTSDLAFRIIVHGANLSGIPIWYAHAARNDKVEYHPWVTVTLTSDLVLESVLSLVHISYVL